MVPNVSRRDWDILVEETLELDKHQKAGGKRDAAPRAGSRKNVREPTGAYKLKPSSMGDVSADYNPHKSLALADHLEDEEIVGKLRRRQ